MAGNSRSCCGDSVSVGVSRFRSLRALHYFPHFFPPSHTSIRNAHYLTDCFYVFNYFRARLAFFPFPLSLIHADQHKDLVRFNEAEEANNAGRLQ